MVLRVQEYPSNNQLRVYCGKLQANYENGRDFCLRLAQYYFSIYHLTHIEFENLCVLLVTIAIVERIFTRLKQRMGDGALDNTMHH